MMTAITMPTAETRFSQRLLLASLALNLFLVGAAGALVIRHYSSPEAASATVDRSIAGRVDRIAATLPAADADILKAAFGADRGKIEAAQTALRAAQDDLRGALRAEPFDLNALRGEMAKTLAARQTFDQPVYDMFATAAAKMSVAGRNKLADWPGSRNNASQARTGEAPKQ